MRLFTVEYTVVYSPGLFKYILLKRSAESVEKHHCELNQRQRAIVVVKCVDSGYCKKEQQVDYLLVLPEGNSLTELQQSSAISSPPLPTKPV